MVPLGTPAQVEALRLQLWDAGFTPIAVINPDADHASAGKAPLQKGWQNGGPPGTVSPDALNTGILCDGLRAIDIDIDNATIAASVRAKALDAFGETVMRYRANSPRVLLLYRAAEGTPPKRAIAGTFGKVEVLGRGQQFVGFGVHPSGADLQWMPEAPGDFSASELPAITEDAITAFLVSCAGSIGAKPEAPPHNGDRQTNHKLGADTLQVVAALSGIPNTGPADWEAWNRIGMATWAATGGGAGGLAAFHAWSEAHPSYDAAATTDRWNHYATSPPTQIGAGTLFYLAKQHRVVEDDLPEWEPPDEEPDAPPHVEPRAATESTKPPALWVDAEAWAEADIVKRPWIAPGYLLRGAVTVLSGPGSAGKSSLVVGWSIGLALDKTWNRFHPTGRMKVFNYNTEDDRTEQHRRMSATLRQFGAVPQDLARRVIRIGPTGTGSLLHRDPNTGRLMFTQAMNELEALLEAERPDVLILDPLVELHDAEENDNTALRAVMARFRAVAVQFDLALVLIHHARKGSGSAAGDPDSLRGASSIVGAARVVLTVLTMDEEQAGKLGIPSKDRGRYFRVDGAKSNYAPLHEAEWFQRVEYEIDNGERIAAAVPWEPPSVFGDITLADIHAMLDRIAAGPTPGILYAPTRKGGSSRWVGQVVVEMSAATDAQARHIVSMWIKSGLLVVTKYHHPDLRREVPGVLVDDEKRPEV